MRKSIVVTLMVLCLTVSLASIAAAERGYLFVGTDFHGTGINEPAHTIVAGEFQFTDQFALGVDKVLGDSGFGLGARYGVGTGVYANVYIDSGSVPFWTAGAFIEREVSERLDLRAVLGVFVGKDGSDTVFVPSGAVQLKYDLDGPFAIMGEITMGTALVGLGYQF